MTPKVRVKEVGEVLVERVAALLTILSIEPKHSALDGAYAAVKAVMDKLAGTPERHSGMYTAKGETLNIPEQEPVSLFDDWDETKPELIVVPNETVETAETPKTEGADASGEQSAAGSNGDSGASSGKTGLGKSGAAKDEPPTAA